ncbi:phosphocarrier protein NPr [bacterium BMS3Bbin10]|nr:phosphocarrier protein NPr [bacterium BMS3Bbin10]
MSEEGQPRDGQSPVGVFSGEVVIPNLKGLHARASAKFVKCAEGFDAEVRVTREGQTVLGTSIMGLMMLAAAQGNAIVIETEGAGAQQALAALVALVEAGFNEEA